MPIHLRVRAVASIAALLLGGAASAATHTWSGAGANPLWSTAANWSAGGPPANFEVAATLIFPAAQLQMATMVNDLIGLDCTAITFSDTAYDVSGAAITLSGAPIATITVDGGTAYDYVDFRLPMTMTVDIAVVPDATHFIDFRGAISGPGQLALLPSLTGGTAGLSAANNYTGPTLVTGGYLVVRHSAGLGSAITGTTVNPGGTLVLEGVTVVAEALSMGGGGAFGNGTLQSAGATPNTWSGPITLTSNSIFTAIDTGQPLTITGPVGGSAIVTYRAASGITLTAANTYAGLSEIEYGTVVMNGSTLSSSFQITGNGFPTVDSTLAGTGTVAFILLGAGGAQKIVAPGPVGAGTGILSCGGIDLNGPGGVFSVRLNGTTLGTGYDQLAVTGSVDVTGATLEVDLGYAAALADSFVILNNDSSDPVTGTFAGLPQGATFSSGGRTFQISYIGGSGNDITLTVTSLVPVELQSFDAD